MNLDEEGKGEWLPAGEYHGQIVEILEERAYNKNKGNYGVVLIIRCADGKTKLTQWLTAKALIMWKALASACQVPKEDRENFPFDYDHAQLNARLAAGVPAEQAKQEGRVVVTDERRLRQLFVGRCLGIKVGVRKGGDAKYPDVQSTFKLNDEEIKEVMATAPIDSTADGTIPIPEDDIPF